MRSSAGRHRGPRVHESGFEAGKSSIQDSTQDRGIGLPRAVSKGRRMADETPRDDERADASAAVDAQDESVWHGAVVAAVVPDQSDRVLREAARYAMLQHVPLVVVNVDVTRFVTFEDPDGYVHSSPIDLQVIPGEADLDLVRAQVTRLLSGRDLRWDVRQLVGDPAIAVKKFAEEVDARLIVVGTRRRGIGESIREFFTGSVAVRLAHRQHRPILVVPLGEPLADDQSIWPDEDSAAQ